MKKGSNLKSNQCRNSIRHCHQPEHLITAARVNGTCSCVNTLWIRHNPSLAVFKRLLKTQLFTPGFY